MNINDVLKQIRSGNTLSKCVIDDFIEATLKNIDISNGYIYKYQRIMYIKESLKINQYDLLDNTLLLEITVWYFIINKLVTPKWVLHRFKTTYNTKNIHYYSIKDFQRVGYLIEDIVYDSVLLSAEEIYNYSVRKDDIEKWLKIRKANADLFIGMSFSGMLIGHLGAVALSNTEYINMKSGLLNEDEISSSSLSMSTIDYLYFPTIVIKKDFRKPLLVKNLILNFFKFIFQSKKLETLKSIVVNVYTPEGRHLCEKLGFEFLCEHKDGGEVYELLLMNIDNKLTYIEDKFIK